MYLLYESYTDECRNLKDLLENKNILGACRVYNEGIEIYGDYYMIILEKIKEEIKND